MGATPAMDAPTQSATQTIPHGDTSPPETPIPPPKPRTRHPRLTMTGDLAELACSRTEQGIPPEVALHQLGYTKRQSKRAMKSEAMRMVQLRKIEEAGGTEDALAKVVTEALTAEYVEVAKAEGRITDEKAYADHPTRLQAFDRILDLKGLTGTRSKHQGTQDERPILNIQAGAKVQLVFFGKAIDAIPD